MGKVFSEVRFEFEAGGKALDVISFTIDEGLSTPFCGELKLSSRQRRIEAEDMLNMTGTLKIYQNKKLTRIFSGIVQNFEKGDDTGRETRYNLTLVPAFARFSLRYNSRIFQHKSVVDILEQMLKEFRITNYELRMMNVHETRDYCVQYRETDLDFLHRILAEEGISYFFEYGDDTHKITFNDHTPRSVSVDGDEDILYEPSLTAMPDKPYIRKFLLQNKLTPTKAELADYNFLKPGFTLTNDEIGVEAENQNGDYHYYDYPARYQSGDVGKVFTKARINYLRRAASTALGESDLAQFMPGFYFPIKEQYLERYNQSWLLTQVRHIGEQSPSLEEMSSEGKTDYRNEFSALPLSLPWSPSPKPKPEVGGPTVAVVTGPPGEEIYVDEYGRVRVLFKWDRMQTPEPSHESERTCWIRVSDGWAGAGRGMVALPRIGDEVLVSFLDGDPDRPIITGRTYHAHNLQPFTLPGRKTVTGIKTKTHRGEGYNELSFDDENHKQLIHIHAQKDMDTKVLNDRTTHVLNDHKETIDGHQTITVKKNQAETVYLMKAETIGLAKALTVGAGYQVSVGAAMNTTVGASKTEQVMMSASEKIGKSLSIEAGTVIELKCGKSVIRMDKDGRITIQGSEFLFEASGHVQINGKLIDLN